MYELELIIREFLQEEDCEDLDNTNLVKYSHVISIYFMSMGSLIIFICLLFTLVIACKKN